MKIKYLEEKILVMKIISLNFNHLFIINLAKNQYHPFSTKPDKKRRKQPKQTGSSKYTKSNRQNKKKSKKQAILFYLKNKSTEEITDKNKQEKQKHAK